MGHGAEGKLAGVLDDICVLGSFFWQSRLPLQCAQRFCLSRKDRISTRNKPLLVSHTPILMVDASTCPGIQQWPPGAMGSAPRAFFRGFYMFLN
jgi:hypothetical protein